MAIEHRAAPQAQAIEQLLEQCLQRRLGPAGVAEAADPHLQHAGAHGEHPAIALGNPIAAQHETELIGPALPGQGIHLDQPLHPHTAHQRMLGGGRLPQQGPMLSTGIHHPVGLNGAALASGTTQLHASARAMGPPALRTPAQGNPRTGRLGAAGQPVPQRPEIQHRAQRLRGLPLAPLPTGPQQLPTAPAGRDHRLWKLVLLHGRPGHGGAAEGRLTQVRQAVHHHHIHAGYG